MSTALLCADVVADVFGAVGIAVVFGAVVAAAVIVTDVFGALVVAAVLVLLLLLKTFIRWQELDSGDRTDVLKDCNYKKVTNLKTTTLTE